MRLLASAPVFHRGRPAPATRWEKISRVAEIVRGADQWHQRLERYARIQEHELAAERAVTERDPHPEHFEAELAATRDLQAFVATLVDDLAVDPQAGWRELAAWAEGLVRDHLAPETRRADWPEVERQAAEKVEAALARLAGLDAVEAAPGVAVFRRTLELELDADLGRVGRLGDGLLMGHVALGLGLDLDRVFVCGLAEGLFPTRVRDDSLLPDADRRATDGALPLRSARVDDDHRRLLAALASASQRAHPPVPPRRPAPHHRAGAVALPRREHRRGEHGASPRRSRRAPCRLVHAGAVVRGRARARRVPCHRAGAPAAHAARPRPGRRRGHHARAARRRRRVAPRDRGGGGARSGREFTRFDGNLAGYDAGPRDRRRRRGVAHPPADLRRQPVRVLPRVRPARRHPRAARGALRGVAARPRQPGARDARRVPERGARAAGRRARARGAVDRRRPRPPARDRRGPVRGLRGAGAHRPPAVLAPRPTTGARRARPVPHRGHEGTRRASVCAPSPPSCASASPTPHPPSTSSSPTAAPCGSAAPPTGSTAPPAAGCG